MPRGDDFPTPEEHLEQAAEFYRDFEDLGGGKPGWAVTALFYSSLHLVQAYAIRKGERPADHEDRRRFVHARFDPRAAAAYRRLETFSRKHRYRCWKPAPQVLSEIYDQDFEVIRRELHNRNVFWR
ncbi:MAG: hypothetical protein ACO1SX_25380 [Actinomycetota bacterium]